jgi:hypothetical protein
LEVNRYLVNVTVGFRPLTYRLLAILPN